MSSNLIKIVQGFREFNKKWGITSAKQTIYILSQNTCLSMGQIFYTAGILWRLSIEKVHSEAGEKNILSDSNNQIQNFQTPVDLMILLKSHREDIQLLDNFI